MNTQILRNKKLLIIIGLIIVIFVIVLIIIIPLKKRFKKSSDQSITTTSTQPSAITNPANTSNAQTTQSTTPTYIQEELVDPYKWLLSDLPYDGDRFSINYVPSTKVFDIALKINQYPISSTRDQEIQNTKNEVENWFKTNDIDPASIKINYSIKGVYSGAAETDVKLLLPIARDNFQISYNSQKDKFEVYIFTDYRSGSRDEQYQKAKNAADQWFKDRNVDLASINIDYFETGR